MSMGALTHELSEGKIISAEELIHNVYNMAPIPLPKFAELRERFMYDITPFSAAMNSASHKAVYSGEDGPDYMHELTYRGGWVVRALVLYHTCTLVLMLITSQNNKNVAEYF